MANYEETSVPRFELPALVQDPGRLATQAGWEARRPVLIDLLSRYQYGYTPLGEVEVTSQITDEAESHGGIRRQVDLVLRRQDIALTLKLLIVVPLVDHPVPAFLGLSFGGNQTVTDDPAVPVSQSYTIAKPGVTDGYATEQTRGSASHRWPIAEILRRGYGLVTLHCGDVDADRDDGFAAGPHRMFYESGQSRPGDAEWGTIGAWAWGLSRVLDHLGTVPEIDGERVIAVGHSRLGKTALWAAAQDLRFAGAISSCSGCGGAALHRRCYGEQISDITTRFPHWFCRDFAGFAGREADLPVDQHMLLALLAPRMLHVSSACDDLWADPHGEYLSVVAANAAYEVYGSAGVPRLADHNLLAEGLPVPVESVGGAMRYHRRTGGHDVTPDDWNHYLVHANAMASLHPDR